MINFKSQFEQQLTKAIRHLPDALQPIIRSFEISLREENINRRNEKFYPLMLEAVAALKEANTLFRLERKADNVQLHYFKNAKQLQEEIPKAFFAAQDLATFYLSPRVSDTDIVAVFIVGCVARGAEPIAGSHVVSSEIPHISPKEKEGAIKILTTIIKRYNNTHNGRANVLSPVGLEDADQLRRIEDALFRSINQGIKNDEKRIDALNLVIENLDILKKDFLAQKLAEEMETC